MGGWLQNPCRSQETLVSDNSPVNTNKQLKWCRVLSTHSRSGFHWFGWVLWSVDQGNPSMFANRSPGVPRQETWNWGRSGCPAASMAWLECTGSQAHIRKDSRSRVGHILWRRIKQNYFPPDYELPKPNIQVLPVNP